MSITKWMAAAALAALAGCGGGGGGSAATPGDSSPITVSGTAATGAAMAGAAISLLCNDGGPATAATAGANGKYTMTIPASCAAPYMLKASAGGVTLYAFADAAGNINITPFTDIAAGIATKSNTAAEYAAILAASKKVSEFWSTSIAQAIRAQMQAKLESLGVSFAGLTDFLHAVFEAKPGDKLDDALEKLRVVRGNVPLSSIVEQIVQAGGSPMDRPWRTLFGHGMTSRTISASGCTLDHASVQPATVTLTMSGDRLVVALSGGGVIDSPSVEVGGDGSDFQFYYPAGTAANQHVQVATLGPEAKFQLTYDGQKPLLYFLSIKGTLACDNVPEGILPGNLHAFDVPARMNAMVGTSTNVASPPAGCPLETNPSVRYAYAVSALGEPLINGQNYAEASLREIVPYAGYNEVTSWTSGVPTSLVVIGSFRDVRISLQRNGSRLLQGCSVASMS